VCIPPWVRQNVPQQLSIYQYSFYTPTRHRWGSDVAR
jgi:hypothetical protein